MIEALLSSSPGTAATTRVFAVSVVIPVMADGSVVPVVTVPVTSHGSPVVIAPR